MGKDRFEIGDHGTLLNVADVAWREYRRTGSATVLPGVFLEKGRDIPRGEGEEPLDPDSCYLTTDDGAEPRWIRDFDDLFEEMRDIFGMDD